MVKIWYQVRFHTHGAVYCRCFDTAEEAERFCEMVKDGQIQKREVVLDEAVEVILEPLPGDSDYHDTPMPKKD